MGEWHVSKNHIGDLEFNPGLSDCRVCVGTGHWVEIDKLYGPAVFTAVRVKACLEGGAAYYLVQRQNIKTNEWSDVVRIEAVLPGELDDSDG